MANYLVGALNELEDGGRRVVSCDGTEVGVFKIDGELFAWYNHCAHMRGPVCQGGIYKRVLEPVAEDRTTHQLQFCDRATHLVCPWHGYEYNLKTGENQVSPRFRLRKAVLMINEGNVYVVV
jgi:nitrite reductase (NADH) small subunit